jgi:hypothetical protein
VLATGVISDRDPQVDFWNAVITNIYIRDPIRPVAEQLQVLRQQLEHVEQQRPVTLADPLDELSPMAQKLRDCARSSQ